MVAHTGFLLTARRLADGVTGLTPKRRASKSEFSAADLKTWAPEDEQWDTEALGERAVSDKRLRRAAKDAASTVQRGAFKNGDQPDNSGGQVTDQ
jgi:tRNA (adenine57-N1/adenine58-N1)-methyltransferase